LRQNGTAFSGGGSSQWSNSGANVFLLGSNVGIGTTNPTASLHVFGQTTLCNDNTILTIYNTNSGATGTTRPTIALTNPNVGAFLIQQQQNGIGSIQNWGSASTGAGIVYLGSGDSNTNIVHTFAGCVNIGETGFAAVNYNSYRQVNLSLLYGTGSNSASNNIYFQIGRSNAANESMFLMYTYNPTTPTNSYFSIANYGGAPVFTQTVSGNVGIGTTTPQSRLEINGGLTLRGTGINAISFINSNNGGQCFVGGVTANGALSGSALSNDMVMRADGVGGTGRIHIQCGAGAAAITVNSNNFVGIGTTSPFTQLEVNGVITTRHTSTPQITLVNSNNNQTVLIAMATSATQYSSSAASNDLVIRSDNATSRVHLQSGTGAAAITVNSNNFVGIGTTTPGSILQIESNVLGGLGPVFNLRNPGGNPGAAVAIDFNTYNGVGPGTSNSSGARLQVVDGGGFSNSFVFSTKTPGSMTNGLSERMRITSGGNVGIGTGSPNHLLDVNGRINSTSMSTGIILSPQIVAYSNMAFDVHNNSNAQWISLFQGNNIIANTGIPQYGIGCCNFQVGIGGFSGISFYTSGIQRAFIGQNGNVNVNQTLSIGHMNMYIDGYKFFNLESSWPTSNVGVIINHNGTDEYNKQFGAQLLLRNSSNGQYWNLRGPNRTDSDSFQLTHSVYTRFSVYTTGNMRIEGDTASKSSGTTWATFSDERIKKNIVFADVQRCYDIIKSVPLKHYSYKDEDVYANLKDKNRLGWIAQDVETVFPKAVTESVEKQFGLSNCKQLDVDQLYAAMYGAIQCLQQKVESQEDRICYLERELLNKSSLAQ
jgi:hypothetical protein